MSSAAKTNNIYNVGRLLAWGLGLLYVFSRLIPCHPVSDYTVDVPVDNAWGQVMHSAFARHLQFGRDIIFTYGPWGFLARGYYPPTYLISVAAWLALSVVFICAGWRVARCFTSNQVLIWLWLVGFTAMASVPAGSDISDRLAAWGVLLLFLHFLVEDTAFSPLQAVLAFTLGWLGLVKFAGFMEGGVLVAVIAMDNILRHRRFPWIIPVWLSGIIVFWLLAGQHLNLLWPFLRNSWAMANGYTEAMNDGDVFMPDPLIYVVLGSGFCILGGLLFRPPRAMKTALFVSGLGGILFLSFKQGYVRNDDLHEITAAVTLLLIGLACLAAAIRREKSLMLTAVGLFCAASLFASLTIGRKEPAQNFCRQLSLTFNSYNLLSPVVSLTTRHLQDDYEKSSAQIRDGIPLPQVTGEADLYSYHQDVLLANGLNYHPRPVIQSYSAYTPALAKMNADWLRTDQAASNLFFAIQGLDSRYHALDDGLSWPELLTRYDIKGVTDPSGRYLWLLRSPTPREYHLQPLEETNIILEHSFALPKTTNGLIWAEIDFKKTFAGDLLSFFYKPTVPMVNIKLASSLRWTRRIVPGAAKAGFLLSPYISSNESFTALASGDKALLAGKEVVSLTFFESGASGSFCYQPQIKIRLYRLEFPAQQIRFQIPQQLQLISK